MNDLKIEIKDLTMAYGSFVVMHDINAQIKRGSVFVIMGGSGCGKSTLLRGMVGLMAPAKGDVFYDGQVSGARTRTPGKDAAKVRRVVPKRRLVEFDDAGREYRAAAHRVHRASAE